MQAPSTDAFSPAECGPSRVWDAFRQTHWDRRTPDRELPDRRTDLEADSDAFSRANASCGPRASGELSAPRDMSASSTVREPNGPGRLNETTNRADIGARGETRSRPE